MTEIERVFQSLRSVMLTHAKVLDCVSDDDARLYLNTKHIQKDKKPLFFGSVQLKKGSVGYYLMPVYTHPALLDGISAPLRKTMTGKSCFTFKAVDDALLAELAALTKAGFQQYQKEGFI